MKTRILFFDDEPETCVRLKGSTVLRRRLCIVCPILQDCQLFEINVNKAELMIHSAHRTQTHWDVCSAVCQTYPQFPTLHFATGPSAEVHDKPLKGAFHQKLRPLIPEKDFLKRVRKLVFLGRLKRENDSLRRAVNLQANVDRVFDTLDIQDLKHRTVDFFAKEFKAQNAYYLSPGGYSFFLEEMWKVSSLGSSEDSLRNLINTLWFQPHLNQ